MNNIPIRLQRSVLAAELSCFERHRNICSSLLSSSGLAQKLFEHGNIRGLVRYESIFGRIVEERLGCLMLSGLQSSVYAGHDFLEVHTTLFDEQAVKFVEFVQLQSPRCKTAVAAVFASRKPKN